MSVMKRKQIIVTCATLALVLLVSAIAVAWIVAAQTDAPEPRYAGTSEPLIGRELEAIREGAYVARLVLRPFEEGLCEREVEAIRGGVIAMAIAKGILDDDGPRAKSKGCWESPEPGSVVVAFGMVIGLDGVPSSFGALANEGGVAGSHRSALEWYHTKLYRAQERYQKQLQRLQRGSEG